MLKQQRHNTLEEIKHAATAPLNHLFDDHSACNESWCLAKLANKEGKQYLSKDGPYLSKIKDKDIYEDIQKVVNQFSTDERLLESVHGGDTQANEALNNTLAYLAPKNTHYSNSTSLLNRVAVNAALQITTHVNYWTKVYQKLGMNMSKYYYRFLQRKDVRRSTAKRYKITLEYKRRRKYAQGAKVLAAIREEQIIERDNLGGYGAGLAINTLAELEKGKLPSKPTKKKSGQCACGSTTHKRKNSKLCRLNPKNALLCLPAKECENAVNENCEKAVNENEGGDTRKSNNTVSLNNTSTEKHTNNIEMTEEEIKDSTAYVESIRENYQNMSDSDEESIDVEAFLDHDDLTLFAM